MGKKRSRQASRPPKARERPTRRLDHRNGGVVMMQIYSITDPEYQQGAAHGAEKLTGMLLSAIATLIIVIWYVAAHMN